MTLFAKNNFFYGHLTKLRQSFTINRTLTNDISGGILIHFSKNEFISRTSNVDYHYIVVSHDIFSATRKLYNQKRSFLFHSRMHSMPVEFVVVISFFILFLLARDSHNFIESNNVVIFFFEKSYWAIEWLLMSKNITYVRKIGERKRANFLVIDY